MFIVQNQLLTTDAAAPATETRAACASTTLSDGRTLNAWIEGTVLRARIADMPATVVDPRASLGCTPVLAAFADGSALLVWRGAGEGDLRDLHFTRFTDGSWKPAAVLNPDGWRTPSDLAGEGPAIDSRGAHVAIAWFTAAEGPRVNVSTSSSAGVQWLMPNRVDDVTPIGRVSVVMLDDGAQLVSWVERLDGNYAVLLRRISARGTLSVPVQLARLATDPGHPHLTRVKDGDATPAQLLLTYTEGAALAARLITLPDASLLAEADVCDCDPRPEEQRGYAFQARVAGIDSKAGSITLTHGDIPGVMKSATTTFKAAPALIATAQVDKRVWVRIERLGPDWWLLNMRMLITP